VRAPVRPEHGNFSTRFSGAATILIGFGAMAGLVYYVPHQHLAAALVFVIGLVVALLLLRSR
jgi:hypothetical protein